MKYEELIECILKNEAQIVFQTKKQGVPCFFAIKLKFKLYQIHLVRHELIREMGVNSSNKAF